MSPSDLRRTFCSWLVNRGVATLTIAKLMGHSTTRMVEQVYGRLSPKTLGQGLGALGDVGLAPLAETAPQPQEVSLAIAANCSTDCSKHDEDGKHDKMRTAETLRADIDAMLRNLLRAPTKANSPPPSDDGPFVLRDRIELPTRGFSGLFSLVREGSNGEELEGGSPPPDIKLEQ